MNTLAWQTPRIAPAWRVPTLAVVALIALLLLRYRETALAMFEIWSRSDTFTHAFVVPPITLWLIWRQRTALQRLQPRPVPWMVPVLAALAAAWWVGHLVAVNAVTQFALTAMIVAAVPTVLGWQVARALAFPLAFLFFAVPFGEFLTPTLMQYTADFTVAALRFTGVPVYREGQQFIVPSGHWSVVEECGGIRYLMASVMVGSLFAYLNYRSLRRRVVFIAASFVVPIVANWMRAYLIVMIGHLSGNRLATGVDHIIYGWVFFGAVITALFFVGARWAEPDAVLPALPAGATEPANPPTWAWLGVVAAALLVLQLPFVLRGATPADEQVSSVPLPQTLAADWHAEPVPLSTWRPSFVGASQEATLTYASAAGRVGVYIAYYRNESENRKLVSSVNVLVHSIDKDWNLLAQGRTTTATPAGEVRWHTAEILASTNASGGERVRLTVWRAYWIGGHIVTSDVQAKLLQAWRRISGLPDDSAAIIFYTNLADDAAANRLLARFAQANLGPLLGVLSQVRVQP